MILGMLRLYFFLEIRTIALERESKLPYYFFHIVARPQTLLALLGEHPLGGFVILNVGKNTFRS